AGNLVGPTGTGGTNTITYASGFYSFSFAADASGTITAAYTADVVGLVLSQADVAANVAIAGTLTPTPITTTTVDIFDSSVPAQQIIDDGAGNLVGATGTGGTNTINYTTGAASFSFAALAVAPITVSFRATHTDTLATTPNLGANVTHSGT